MAVRPGAWPRHAHTYRLPELLADIRLLDLLELSGSTRQASQLLQLSQPTVSRRYRALADDFALRSEMAADASWRFGSNATMRLLRLSCRCHRLEAGVARLGADLLHHGLLEHLPWLLPSPPRFRPLQEWLELVRQGVLDGALVSQLELDLAPPQLASDLELHRVGRLPLALTWARTMEAPSAEPPRRVLVPAEALAAGLRRQLNRQGWALRGVGPGCTTPQQWLQLLRRSGCAMPVASRAQQTGGEGDGFAWRPLPDGIVSPVWLALPRTGSADPLLRLTLERLRAHPALVAQ